MNKKALGPPPDWIVLDSEQDEGNTADPLRSIFNEARAARTAELDEQSGLLAAVHEKAREFSEGDVDAEIKRRLRLEHREPGGFALLYGAPSFSSDVAEAAEPRLVILGPGHPHSRGDSASSAVKAARGLLAHRGAGPRAQRNTLVFLAADAGDLEELRQAVRSALAWRSAALPAAVAKAEEIAERRLQSDQILMKCLAAVFRWLLVPAQESPAMPVFWREAVLEGSGAIGPRAYARLVDLGYIVEELSTEQLMREIEKLRGWYGEPVNFARLDDYFTRSPALPRLAHVQALQKAIEAGLAHPPSERSGQGQGTPMARSFLPGLTARRKSIPEHGPRRFRGTVAVEAGALAEMAGSLTASILGPLAAISTGGVRVGLEIEADIAPSAELEDVQRMLALWRQSHLGECDVTET